MAWQGGLFSLLSFAAAGISVVVILLAWRHRFEGGARAFFGVLVAIAGWSFVYGIQLGFETHSAQLAWQPLALSIGGTIPTLWLIFAFHYTGREGRLTRPLLGLLAVEPIVFALLALSNPSHGFIWQQAVLTPIRNSYALTLTFNAGYFAHIAYSYILVAIGISLLFAAFVQSEFYRIQTGLLIFGTLPPLIGHVAHTLGLAWGPLPALDPTPILFSITGLFFAIVQFDLLDRVSVARAHALHETADGFVVLDTDERIISFNPAAGRLLESPAIGKSIYDCLPTLEAESDEDIDGTTVTTTVSGSHRVFELSSSSLIELHGTHIGWVISARDVTDRQAYEQRLEVAHRILRHNLRNQMNVIHGWAKHIESTGPAECTRAAQQITRTAEKLMTLGEKSQSMVATTGTKLGEPKPVKINTILDPILDELSGEHPDVSIEAEVPSSATVSIPDPELLRGALENLLENAVVHNDVPQPRVRVTVEQSKPDVTHTRIRVEDNGPGIAKVEREVLKAGSETPLQHGSGIGLWLVYWNVRAMRGDVSFEPNDPRGSIVSLALPAGDITTNTSTT